MYKRTLKVKQGEASATRYTSFEYSYCIMKSNKCKRVLACVYRLQEVCITFREELERFMEVIFHKAETVIVVGDFNIWFDIKDNADTIRIKTLMKAYGLTQLIKEPTQSAGHTLDHVYVNKCQTELKCKVEVGYEFSSDHFPVIIEIPVTKSVIKTETITFRNTRNMQIDEMKNELKELYANMNIEQSTNFETAYNEYKISSQKVIDKYAPEVTKKVIVNMDTPWVDEEFKAARRERRKLEKQWRRCKSEENRKKYVVQRELCAGMSVEKQKGYYARIVEESGNDQKSLFNVVKNMLDKRETRTLPEHTDEKELANEFNAYYIKKIEDLRETIPTNNLEVEIEKDIFSGTTLDQFAPTTEEELREILKESGIKTSCEDPIPAKILKIVIDETLPALVKLINKSFSEGSVDGVKLSIIDPLLKKAGLDAETRKNYRPVNNLVFFSKLIERTATKQMDAHMLINNLFCDNNFAYKKYHSTETMMLGLVNDVLLGFDDNLCTVVVFLDLSAASDTIDIEKLLTILSEEIGITGIALKWFRSFLTGRTQKVRIEQALSECLEVLFGTVQGSVLGPKLFNIYVRSQHKVFEKCMFKTTAFADDSNGAKTFSLKFQFNTLKYSVAECMREITSWMNINFLKINPEKTEILLFYPPSLASEVIIKGTFIEGKCIRFSNEVKNVGVVLDKNLNFDKHVNKVAYHRFKLLKYIGRVQSVMTTEHIEMLVHAVASSRLEYCNSLFFNMNKEKTNNSFCRPVTTRYFSTIIKLMSFYHTQ